MKKNKKNGWIFISIEGAPFERGQQHGELLKEEINLILKNLKNLTYLNTGKQWDFFVKAAKKIFVYRMNKEFLDEIKGIAKGAGLPWEDILTWNGYEELTDYWWPQVKLKQYAAGDFIEKDHCSAFLAVGSATKDGKIVMAHNSWADFESGQFNNIIIDIKPEKGHRILMQTMPGFIDSMTDFFVTDAGLMGTEVTLGGFSKYNAEEDPEFYRARKAMQYADDLDDFVKYMKKKNSGGYANAWLVADVNKNEIMKFELGLKHYSVRKKKDGYFIGFNAPEDPAIRHLECAHTGFADIRRHQGARRVRLTQLMEQYHGKLTTTNAKKILADHYDVFLKKNNPCSRTVDGHYELDDRKYLSLPGRPLPFQPRGTVDGKVIDSAMAEKMSFSARFGNSSGMPFDARKFLKNNIQWDHLEGYLHDRPARPWTEFSI
ncbi:hypothetical protein KKC88_00325 [Patescibacteria group bacterium]|nr:hypothetical protein [Patescibacteria group bacterium]MBU1672910.1 hypothetical protein [Patescibacteria group bacterium]MBU1963381.1 hypothetical protein [Patescibacteria group bacterium]